MNAFVTLLQNKEKQVWLSGNNIRLFYQNAMEGYDGEVTKENAHVVAAGWHVITWQRSKPITLYFGNELMNAIEIFDAHNN